MPPGAEFKDEDMQPQLVEQDGPVSVPSSSPSSQPSAAPRSKHEPSVRDIIEAARSAPAAARAAVLCSLSTSVLLYLSFTPVDLGWLSWLALAPLLLLARPERGTRWMYRISYASGLAWSLATLQWMRLGDAAMYPAWFALSIYLALYFPLFLAVTRGAVHRLKLPLLIAAPVAWTGLEFLRAHLMTGFAWYFLGHTQYAWPEMIQISDLVGAYGVSFTVALTSACLAALAPAAWLQKLKLLPPVSVPEEFQHLPSDELQKEHLQKLECRRPWLQVGLTLSLLAAVLTYGFIRRSQADFQPGPRVALIQGNFPTSIKHDPSEFRNMFRVHDALTGMAVRHQPDLVVWPETMFRWPLHVVDQGVKDADLLAIAPPMDSMQQVHWLDSWKDPAVRQTLQAMSEQAGAALMIGIETWQATTSGLRVFNSAAFVTPREGLSGRYDKMHRVIFGEYVPLQNELPFLAAMTPVSANFGLTKGEKPKTFRLRDWNLSPVICFEDTVPHLVRDIHRGSNETIDVLVNLTNDGWFKGSSELDQHLITAAFRAVENRTPMVRAVNTGISAVIDGDGVIREPEVFLEVPAGRNEPIRSSLVDPATGRWRKSINAAVISTVPLDHRTSFYTRHGDWFAASCLLLTIGGSLMSLIRRARPLAVKE